jgi:hypothetical protein
MFFIFYLKVIKIVVVIFLIKYYNINKISTIKLIMFLMNLILNTKLIFEVKSYKHLLKTINCYLVKIIVSNIVSLFT